MTLNKKNHSWFRDLLNAEATGGIVLMAASLFALFIANSFWSKNYFDGLAAHIGPMSLIHWINDGLMALFFLLVGLEIKREFIKGELATWHKRALPGCAALGGMIVPALCYCLVNLKSQETIRGWSIPTATDIAFALGALSLLGSRVPIAMKIFLTALAIIDDLGAILIIALFYTRELDVTMLFGAACITLFLICLNRLGIKKIFPYLFLGTLLWFFVLRSGIHATLAGVILASTIPLSPYSRTAQSSSPLCRLEHRLAPWVAFLVIPIFGFANAGVFLGDVTGDTLVTPLTSGIIFGLLLGKPIGVFSFSLLAIKTNIATKPRGVNLKALGALALLCGVGFTMSLFIGLMAFPNSLMLMNQTKIGVMIGSLSAGLMGMVFLRVTLPVPPSTTLDNS